MEKKTARSSHRKSRAGFLVALAAAGAWAQPNPNGANTALPYVPRLRNGSMEWGIKTPEEWKLVKGASEGVSLRRDEKVKVDGQASLRLISDYGEGSVAQRMSAEPGTTFKISGHVRIEGNLWTQVWVQFLGESGQPVGSMNLLVVEGPVDWINFEQDLTVPEDARELKVGFNTVGPGSIWVDRIRFEPVPGMSLSPELATPPPMPEQDPIEPYLGRFQGDTEVWLSVHERQKRLLQATNPKVVFLGDSITELWDERVWARYFDKLGAANLGIRGDRTNQLIYRLQDGLLDGLSPELVIVAVGANNLWKDQFGAERTGEAVKLIVSKVQQRCPKAQILIVGIFPTDRNPDSAFRYVVPEFNKAISKAADGQRVRFVDFGVKFLDPDKSIPKALMPDGLHLGAPGYEVYAKNLAPVVYAILKPK